MKCNDRIVQGITAALMATGSFGVAQAQSLMLEEVIVTAQKREQSLQDVPISVVAFGQEKLEKLGINSLTDIGANIPNFVVNSVSATPTSVRLFVRGIGQGDVQITQDPSVALYLDGVYVGTSVGAGFEGVDIARLEVLRGPQGTLYGRNATGGAVNIVTRRASPEGLEIKQDFTIGNLAAFNANTVVNVPLSDRTAVKFNYYHSERDGVVENDGLGNDFGMQDNDSVVLDFRYDVSDEVTLDYRYEKADMTSSQRLEQVTQEGPGILAGATEITDVSKDRLDDVTSAREIFDNDLEIDAHSLFLDWAIDAQLTAKSITSWREMDNLYYSDALATAIIGSGTNAPSYSVRATQFEQFSQEFQLLGDMSDFNYVAGIYYYADESSQDGAGSSVLGTLRATDFSTAENTSLALFGEGTFTPEWLDGKLHVTLGARYSEDSRKATRDNQVAGFTGEYDKDFSNFNPALTVAFDINDDMNAYAKVVSGFKSGGTSQRSANAELFSQGFEEEDIVSYEIGFKGDFWDRRARVNGALFHMDLDGLQASVQTGSTPGDRDFLPIDGNTVDGLEIDLTLQLTEGLTARVDYGYLDTKLGEDQLSTAVGTFNLIGEMWYAPKNSFSASLDYYLPVSNGAIDMNLNFAYQDSLSTSINIADNAEVDDYGLLGASINWSDITLGSLPGSFRVLLWGKNLLDEEYGTFAIRSWQLFGASEVQSFGDPRTYGVTLSYEY